VDRQYWRDRRINRRKRLLDMLGAVCSECGATDNLQFDHLDPSEKSFKISLIDLPIDRLEAEVKKCQLLCRECHHKKTLKNNEYGEPSQHGTIWRYKHYRCRCSECKSAMSKYLKNKNLQKLP
jgi:5-methylcytosine-specific restriction endonuclease McrA